MRESVSELQTYQVSKIALTAFYKSMFALMIYEYKESHEGVLLPVSMYDIVDPKGTALAKEKIQLPALYVKSGNFAQVKLAMNWVSNILSGVRKGDQVFSHGDLFERGLEVVFTCMTNLNSEGLFEVRETLAQIIKTINSYRDFT